MLGKYRSAQRQNMLRTWTAPRLAILIWLIPASIIFILGILKLRSTHELDPYKALDSKIKHLQFK